MPLPIAFTSCYSEVFGSPPTLQQFRSELAKFECESVIELCAYLNFIHEWLTFSPDPVYSQLLIASSFPPALAQKVLRSGQPLFHRRQCLLIMKEAIRSCRGTIDPTRHDNLGDFGNVLLMANDLFYRDLGTSSLDEDRAKVLVNWLGIIEYLGSALKDTVVRSDRMASLVEAARHEPHALDIAGRFEQHAGVSPLTYRAFCLAILARFIRTDATKFFVTHSGLIDWRQCRESVKVPPDWIGGALVPDDVNRCASLTAGNRGKLVDALTDDKGLEDFTVFRKFPLFGSEGGWTLLDSGFLVEKPETGVFWTVQGLLSKPERRAALDLWGCMVERYVTWLLQNSADHKKNQVYPNPKYTGSTDEVTDVIVMCGDSAVLAECKGGFFEASAKYSGDPEKLEKEIRRKLIEKEGGDPKGARQLARAINAVFGKTSVAVDGIDLASTQTVYPLLIVRDDIGAAPTVGMTLAKEFEAELDRTSLRVSVHPMVTVSVRVVESICRYLAEVPLSEILLARIKSEPQLFSPYWLVPNQVLDSLGIRNNAFVDGEFWRIVRDIAALMFPQQTKSNLPIRAEE